MINRFMRILVMFDLPTDTEKDKREYMNFRKFLLKNGYNMLQYSIYSRICPNSDAVDTHLNRLKKMAPPKGSVRVMIITNKQFTEAKILAGEKTYQEKRINKNQLVLI